jgi:hypothetical protein
MSGAPALALDRILLLARRGWRLFPCVRRSKTPLIEAWPRLASFDPRVLERWSDDNPNCNWAMATGVQSGVFGLDVDGEVGRRSLAKLESEHGPLTITLTTITGREDGGEHRIFKYPLMDVRSSTRRLGAGLHIRAEGGYLVVPESIHPSGRVYQFVDESIPVAEVSNWLLELLLSPTHDSGHQSPAERSILRDGERNDGLIRYAGALRRRGADYAEIEKRLLEANQRRCYDALGIKPYPLPEREIRKIAKSALRWPVGGPDPLELAWQEAAKINHSSHEEGFLELCRCLQHARPGQEIALPLKRIGALMGVDWTSAQKYRQRAVRSGILTPTTQYVAGKQAGRYVYNEATRLRGDLSGAPPLTTKTLTSGLVRIAIGNPSTNGTDPGAVLPSTNAAPSTNATFSHNTTEASAKAKARAQASRRDVRREDYLPWGGRFRRHA